MEPILKHEQHARPGEPLEGRPSPARLLEHLELGSRSGRELSRRRAPLLAAVSVTLSLLATTACGAAGGVNAGQESGGQESTPDPEATVSEAPHGDERDTEGDRAGEAEARDGAARAGDAEAGDDGARAGEARVGAEDTGARAGKAKAGADGAGIAGNSRGGEEGSAGGEEGPRKVTLEITGDRGTEFSGACSVGGTESALDGRVPERYVFEPRGERLGCELRTEGGFLGIVLTDGASVHSEQQTTAGESTVKFTYANGSISSSTSSVSEGRSVTYSDN